jgi:23S rRNA-/tRNA-specific pseudouridylate synthase
MNRLFEIIAEDEDLLALNKPAGLVCHPTKGMRIRVWLGGFDFTLATAIGCI